MLQSNAPFQLDHAATRANILRAAGTDNLPTPTGPQFRDNDIAPIVIPKHIDTAPLAAKPIAHTPFEDLDLAPLPLAVSQSDDAPSPPPQESTNDIVNLTPPMMRRIIQVAVSGDSSNIPYARAQANIGNRGLCFGLGRFCQADGSLGRYLKNCQSADPAQFANIFATPHGSQTDQNLSDTLVSTLSAETTEGRMAPIGGQPLWSSAWITQFKAAAKIDVFQDMQFKTVAEIILQPLLEFAQTIGFNTERALALLVERAILMGLDQAVVFVQSTLSPDAALDANMTSLVAAARDTVLPGMADAILNSQQLGDTPLPLSAPDLE